MDLRVGTSGYSYKTWKGLFYPEDLAAEDMLRYYASRLPSVEINNTFYRLPRASVMQAWADQVPESFRFAIKASQRITHMKRLADVGEETAYLLRTAATLGDRLGTILFQLPPNLKKDLPRLAQFLEVLGEDVPSAFEFRHPSWRDPDVLEVLSARGCALCIADTDDEEPPPIARTTSWGYLRLRRSAYSEEDLIRWAGQIRAQEWDRVFVYFKHEDEALGARFAERFLEIMREPTAP